MHRQGRWNCHDCKSSFNVLSGTIYEKTKPPLQKWFLAVSLFLNAKKSVSSYQLGRVHTKRSASKMSANEMNPRKITSSF